MAEDNGNKWTGKSRGGKLGYQFFVVVVRLFGVGFAYCCLALVAVYFIPFAPKATKAIWIYNRKIRRLGIFASAVELYCHYYSFGQTLIDKVAMKAGKTDCYNYRFDNYERFVDILNSGQGVVMIGAHVGCWEAGAGFFGNYGKKMNIVMFDAEHRQIKSVVDNNTKREEDFKIIAVNHDAIEAMLQMKIALDNGEYICFNGDRYVDDGRTQETEFLGYPVSLPVGPFKIAVKCRVPVVFYFSMREAGKTYRFIFEEYKPDGRADVDSLVRQYVTTLERVVEKYPRQWFNFYDFWNL